MKEYNSYQEYLNSKEWATIRIEVLKYYNFTCQGCGFTSKKVSAFHVHHKHYENIFNEEPKDLTLLCASCHKGVHTYNPADRTPKKRKKKPPLTKEEIDKQVQELAKRINNGYQAINKENPFKDYL